MVWLELLQLCFGEGVRALHMYVFVVLRLVDNCSINTGRLSKAALGKLLRDEAKCIMRFPVHVNTILN